MTNPTDSSRHLRQEELDSIHRERFVWQIMQELGTYRKVRFLLRGKGERIGQYKLIEIEKEPTGKYSFSIGDSHVSRFCYKMSLIVDLLEQVYGSEKWDSVALKGEIQIDPVYVKAHRDAEPDHDTIAPLCEREGL